jgi:hypothetical protein
MEERPLLKEQYKLAIDARNKLNDDFHKWMTYYYVANGAVLVAVISLSKAPSDNLGLIALGLIGLLVSMFWNLSCKGYYYWSKSWILIIQRFEKLLFSDFELQHFGVYALFSKEVDSDKSSILKLNASASISTPKLTMMLSASSIICWFFFTAYRYFVSFPKCCSECKFLVIGLSFIILLVAYTNLFPKCAQSRNNGEHTLV